MLFADFLAGSIGGACGVAVGFPLDTVKVRIQTQKEFTGIWQCVVTTGRREGIHGFFKGMSLPVTTISLTSSVVFGTYRNCLQCLGQIRGTHGTHSKLDVLLSGLAGGVAQVCVMSPGDVVKVRLQCQTEPRRSGVRVRYRGPIHCLLSVGREEGLSGLYRGALPLACRDGPSFATYFLTYNTLCERLTPAGRTEPDWPAVLFSGGVAGMAGWSVGTPMDVVKARLQMDGVRGPRRYRGLVHCLSDTVREGPRLFLGTLTINCLRAFPVNMVVFAVYELSVRTLRSADHTTR